METYYFTNSVLTKGIVALKASVSKSPSSDDEYARAPGRYGSGEFQVVGRCTFLTLGDAKAKAVEKARTSVASKEKALAKAKATLARFEAGDIPVVKAGP